MNHSLVFHISNTAKKIQKSIQYNTAYGELSFTQAITLLIINSQEKISQSGIAMRLYFEPASVVNIIDELTKLELVTRETTTQDRRKYLIALTDKGSKAVKDIKVEVAKLNMLIKNQITNEEYTTLYSILEKIDQKLDKRS